MTLPNARLVPRDRADQVALLKSRATDGAKTAGRAAISVGRALAWVALCGAGLVAIGAGTSTRRSTVDLDRRLETIRHINLDLPKMDFKLEYEKLMQSNAWRVAPTFDQELRMKRAFESVPYERETVETLSPSQRAIWTR